MNQPIAIVFSACILAGTLAFLLRWEIASSGTTKAGYKLDRWSGAVFWCVQTGKSGEMDCK